MSNVRIIFAPQFEPFQPFLSLPYLKELLRLYNIQSSYIDCNVDFYNWLFTINNELLSKENKQEKYLLQNIEQAVSYIKNGITDLLIYRWAINVIEEYLQAISTEKLSISLSNLEIENKYDTDSIKDFVYNNGNLIYEYFDSHTDKIIDSDSDFYFFSLAILEQLPASLIFAKELKKRCSNVKIAFGGSFITRFYNKLQKIEWVNEIVDFIEPEEGFISIAKIFNIKPSYIEHVFPDFSDIDQQQYLSPKPVFPYLVAHGCKWGKCVFCAHHLSYSKYHASLICDVIEDLKKIRQQYGVKYISFSDEYLTQEQLEGLCFYMNKEQLDIKWSTFVRGDKYFTNDFFVNQLYSNGCRVLFFGFETFNQNILNSMKKGTKANDYLPILDVCKNANIAVRIDLMFGFPTETNDEAKQTYETIIRNKDLFDTPFSSIAIALFELKEDTPIFNNPQKYEIELNQLLRGNFDELYDFTPFMENSVKWRVELMRFFKQKTNSELIAPYNKTHQLVLKNLYDEKKLELMHFLTKDNLCNFSFQVNPSVHFYIEQSQYTLSNFANGSEINISEPVGKLLNKARVSAIPYSDFLNVFNDTDIIYELLNFLYRNDFIVLLKK
jgi:radical SAM superfamily enzyme YgiQ (UPF0313 family)